MATYMPQLQSSLRNWPVTGESVRRSVLAAAPQSVHVARRVLRVTASFAGWCVDVGISLDAETMFEPRMVRRWAQTLTVRSAGTYASDAGRVGRAVTRNAAWEPPPTTFARSKLLFYTDSQMTALVQRVPLQSTALRQRRLSAILAGCRGAGLTAAELLTTTGRHFSVVDGVPLLRVQGAKPRLVPVDPEWGDEVARVAEQAGRDPLIEVASVGKNRFSTLVVELSLDRRGPMLSASRLRNSYVRAEVQRGRLPLADLLRATGLQSVNALRDHMLDIPTMDEPALIRLLADRTR